MLERKKTIITSSHTRIPCPQTPKPSPAPPPSVSLPFLLSSRVVVMATAVAAAQRCLLASQVDAFATEPFKDNPSAVSLLEDENAAAATDERWMQSVATEFILLETAFLIRDTSLLAGAAARFHLRWFTPVTKALTNLVVFFGLINFTMLVKDKFCMAVRACRQNQLKQTSLLTGVSSVGIVQPQSTLEVKRCEKQPADNGC